MDQAVSRMNTLQRTSKTQQSYIKEIQNLSSYTIMEQESSTTLRKTQLAEIIEEKYFERIFSNMRIPKIMRMYR